MFTRKNKSSTKSQTKPSKAAARGGNALFENLEGRQLFSVTDVQLISGTAIVKCNDAGDNVKVVMSYTTGFIRTPVAVNIIDNGVTRNSFRWDLVKKVVVNGNGGNDVIDATGAGVSVELHGGSGYDQLYGSNKADALYGDSEGDLLHGNGGDDYLDGGAASDNIYGDDGKDHIDDWDDPDGWDFVDGGNDSDTMTGYGSCLNTIVNVENVEEFCGG